MSEHLCPDIFEGGILKERIRNILIEQLNAAGLPEQGYSAYIVGAIATPYYSELTPIQVVVCLDGTSAEDFNRDIGQYLKRLKLKSLGRDLEFAFQNGVVALEHHPAVYDIFHRSWFKQHDPVRRLASPRENAPTNRTVGIRVELLNDGEIPKLSALLNSRNIQHTVTPNGNPGDITITVPSRAYIYIYAQQLIKSFLVGTSPPNAPLAPLTQESLKQQPPDAPEVDPRNSITITSENAFLLEHIKTGFQSTLKHLGNLVQEGDPHTLHVMLVNPETKEDAIDEISDWFSSHPHPNPSWRKSPSWWSLSGRTKTDPRFEQIRLGSAFIQDIQYKDLPKKAKADVDQFFDCGVGHSFPVYGMTVEELLPKADPANLESARSHMKGSPKTSAKEVAENAEKHILLVNDRIIDGHHFLAKAEHGKVTRSLRVIDLTPIRFQ